MIGQTVQYAILFSGKYQMKKYAELTNSRDTSEEALEDAKISHQDGYKVLGLYVIDMIDGEMKRLMTGGQIIELLEREAA